MTKPVDLPDEARRQAVLDTLALVDTPAERAYDDLCRIAREICRTPIAAVGLIDRDREWFKAQLGMTVTEIPRVNAFCGHVITGHNLLNVPDLLRDARFTENPLVTGVDGFRFYAGAPLILSSGEVIGAVCVIDRTPRTLSEVQLDTLRVVARNVVAQIELRAHLKLVSERERASDSCEYLPPNTTPVTDLRVLVVDDVTINQKVMRAILALHRADVHLAAGGERALELFAQNTYDLILMDRYMPGLDGFETTREMRRLELERGVPGTLIFGASATSDPAERRLFVAAGADDAVAKPLRVDELWTKLNRLRSITVKRTA